MSQSIHVNQNDVESLNILGTTVRFLLKANQTKKRFSVLVVDMPEGEGPPDHHHAWDEAYYVLKGSVKFGIDGAEKILHQGEFIYAPGGCVHRFCGASKEGASMLIMDAPAHSEAFFRAIDSEVVAIPQDLEKVPGIGAEHGLTFLPPQEK